MGLQCSDTNLHSETEAGFTELDPIKKGILVIQKSIKLNAETYNLDETKLKKQKQIF